MYRQLSKSKIPVLATEVAYSIARRGDGFNMLRALMRRQFSSGARATVRSCFSSRNDDTLVASWRLVWLGDMRR